MVPAPKARGEAKTPTPPRIAFRPYSSTTYSDVSPRHSFRGVSGRGYLGNLINRVPYQEQTVLLTLSATDS